MGWSRIGRIERRSIKATGLQPVEDASPHRLFGINFADKRLIRFFILTKCNPIGIQHGGAGMDCTFVFGLF